MRAYKADLASVTNSADIKNSENKSNIVNSNEENFRMSLWNKNCRG